MFLQQQPEQQQQQQQQHRLEEWRLLQEDMLRQYLATAESDLRAKRELADVKQQRLHLARDEYEHLSATLRQQQQQQQQQQQHLQQHPSNSNISASSTSCE